MNKSTAGRSFTDGLSAAEIGVSRGALGGSAPANGVKVMFSVILADDEATMRSALALVLKQKFSIQE
jgi:hypothetical protein